MEKYKGLAADIIKNVGGEENVISLTHCMTRLRFKLKDENLANKETLEAMDGVMTVVQSSGQYQVVIGNAVKDVYETILEQTAIQGGKDTAEEDSQEVKGSLLDRFIDLISSIFTPILSVLVATGMIKGFTALLLALEVMASERGTSQMLNIIGDAFFLFPAHFSGPVSSP